MGPQSKADVVARHVKTAKPAQTVTENEIHLSREDVSAHPPFRQQAFIFSFASKDI
jgi:hypothetical protein